jgi:hypothetical protein
VLGNSGIEQNNFIDVYGNGDINGEIRKKIGGRVTVTIKYEVILRSGLICCVIVTHVNRGIFDDQLDPLCFNEDEAVSERKMYFNQFPCSSAHLVVTPMWESG